MKLASLLLLPVAAVALSSCADPEPERVVEHHYHTNTVYRDRPTQTYSRPAKAAPSVSSERAEEFRAVERPGSYSN